MFALERMVQVMEMTQAAMVYADHYQKIDGVKKTAPVIDYQPGSLRDDFNFSTEMSSHPGIQTLVIGDANK